MSEPTSASRDWMADEYALPGAAAELRRLMRRARRRWARTLLFALLGTAVLVGFVARRPRVYVSRVAFRVTESELEAASSPHTNGRLRDYVAEVIFSNARLLEVIKNNELYPTLRVRDPSLAVEEMRSDLDVDVWRNSFAQRRSADDPGRSARLAVSYHGRDAEKVYAVVTQLGRLIVASEQSSRLQQAEAALRLAEERVRQTRDLVITRKRELVEKEVARQATRSPGLALTFLVQERNLEKAVPRAEKLLAQMEARHEQAYVRLELEKRALGLRWELIDPGRPNPEGMSRRVMLALFGVLGFVLALPLCAVAVGGFDPRVYELGDIRRLGLLTLGAIRPFAGDNAGSLAVRLGDGHDTARAGRARIVGL